MEDITSKLDSIIISKKKVLYYSVSFTNYKDIIKLVKNTLETDDIMTDIYIKTTDTINLYDGKINDLDKKNIIEKYSELINKIKYGENFIIYDENLYIINSEFHITTLFTGGKEHEKSQELESQIGKKVNVRINKLGVSNKFIVLGVESINFEDGKNISYYGNNIKHITIALNKNGKKVFPKDSYTALSDGKVFDLDMVIEGKCSKVV